MEKKYKGYTFKLNTLNSNYRPYEAKCLETGLTKRSDISHDDAIGLIMGHIEYNKAMFHKQSKDKDFVKKLFFNELINKKLSQINDIVNERITGKISGKIIALRRELYDMEQVYLTEYFKVTAKCEKGRAIGITNILVEKVSKNNL